MSHPTPEQIADIVLNRRQVYDLDTDSRIREAANQLTARALFELLARLDDQSPEFTSCLSASLDECPGGPSYMIGWRGDIPTADEHSDAPELPESPSVHYLRLVFHDEDAAYYQFHLFPDLSAEYICGAARKRVGAVQHLCLELNHPDALQDFIESCRLNPHFLRIEESTEQEFNRAPSHGI